MLGRLCFMGISCLLLRATSTPSVCFLPSSCNSTTTLLFFFCELIGMMLTRQPDYFLRALALDPSNPVITLSLGLGYIHYGLKRQAVNRQYLILQGLAFLQEYYESLPPERSDEANYGMGRTRSESVV